MKVFSLAVVCVVMLVSVSGGTHMEMHGQLGELDRAMNLKLNTRRERGKILALFKRLFQTFRKLYKREYKDPNEQGGRFKNFIKVVKMILSVNKGGRDFKAEVNKFTDQSDEERNSNTGMNASASVEDDLLLEMRDDRDFADLARRAPDTLDWVTKGMTTVPMDQEGCASCWAFGTVVPLESRYAITTGKLKRFSVQEILDCSYEYKNVDSGCNGGWYTKSYAYVKKFQHLALDKDLPYNKRDGACTAQRFPNALKAADLVGWKQIKYPTWDQIIVNLNDGPVSVAIRAEGDFFQYGTGVYENEVCSSSVNHGLVAVGYSPTFMLLRNSWGNDWGQAGYVYLTRKYSVCGVTTYIFYPQFMENGVDDDDEAELPESAGERCADLDILKCQEFGSIGCSDPISSNFMKINCRLTCKLCGASEEDGTCPPGTEMCGDVCKHPHMCEDLLLE